MKCEVTDRDARHRQPAVNVERTAVYHSLADVVHFVKCRTAHIFYILCRDRLPPVIIIYKMYTPAAQSNI